jgi:glycosyltransferase involved in cell wall biosynthesis
MSSVATNLAGRAKRKRLVQPQVAVLQRRLPHYRMAFFETLRRLLENRGLSLLLVHGQPARSEQSKRDEGSLPWARCVRNAYWRLGTTELCWQPLPPEAFESGLIVLSQENRILSNYRLLLRTSPATRLAYWGHGANFQSRAPHGWRERWKRSLAARVDWWFAYSAASVAAVRASGFPDDRITCVDNTIDTTAFTRELAACDPAKLEVLRARLRIQKHDPVGLYCGSLYPDKRLDLLLAAARRIRGRLPDFNLILIGGGFSEAWLREEAATEPWVHPLGPLHGADKAACFRIASVFLHPGAVGLSILDTFCAGLPIITTSTAKHGPEIAYLKDGANGVLADNTAEAYAEAVVALLNDGKRMAAISANALADSRRYTIENMANRFAEGAARCLAMERYRGVEA